MVLFKKESFELIIVCADYDSGYKPYLDIESKFRIRLGD